VQLAGAWTPERLEALAEEHQAEHDLLVHRVDRNTRSWYILLYGAFPDRAAAEAAVEHLPPPLRDNRPWVRPIRGLLNP
jgi:septal ring-binding cell division protein DamX